MIQWTRSGIGDATRTYMELDSRGGILFSLGVFFNLEFINHYSYDNIGCAPGLRKKESHL